MSYQSEQIDRYIELLKIVGSLSKLFSENKIPYLYYRVAENIFCEAFNADNLSRSDCSADARIGKSGYGLKTFCYKKIASEKIAEFNKDRLLYSGCSDSKRMIEVISNLRNKRIESTLAIHGLDKLIYHCVTRDIEKFFLYEEEMKLIDISNIKIIKENDNSIIFSDSQFEYSFNISKSTLFKKFNISNFIKEFEVKIFENPLELLEKLYTEYRGVFTPTQINTDIIYLPLYSNRSGKQVQQKSGLNQWNAGGRPRDQDEVYIPIPSRIHDKFSGFFPSRNIDFSLNLPNGERISAKVCQDGSKALMSNPNKKLGKWLLRDILKKDYGSLVEYKDLQEIGIDSVEIVKRGSEYSINFKALGTFEEFENNNL